MPVFQRWLMAVGAESALLLVKIPLVYLVFELLRRLPSSPRKTVGIVVIGLFGLAVALLAHRLVIVKWVLPHMYKEATTLRMIFETQRLISSFMDIALVVGVAVAFKQYRISQQSREREKELEKEKMQAELKFLRSQTNPHFLFNTLNNIYALARKKSDETPGVVMKLSKLLRFMLYEARKGQISISEELRVLQDYIELEKIRYNERLEITLTQHIDDKTQAIAPLILLPFVENAFKHGASESRFSSFVHIEVRLEAGMLSFNVENSKETESAGGTSEGIGLENVRRQLELMYPVHTLEVDNGNEVYRVILNINLRQHATVPMHRGRG